MKYSLYVTDTETTGLNYEHDVIELSIIRLSDDVQKTWFLKPVNQDSIDAGALRINGHVLEDLLWKTKSGKEKYRDPSSVIVEIENWLAEDDQPTQNRILVGQNISFDKSMLENLWRRANSFDTFPFGRRMIDTAQIEFLIDYLEDDFKDNYSLSGLIKKYNIKNAKAHSADADSFATKQLFCEQIKYLKSKLLK